VSGARDPRLPARVGAIGGGNMAEALLGGLLRAGMAPHELVASDPDANRRAHLERALGVRTSASNAEVAAQSDFVVLCVKPGKLAEASAGLPSGPGPLWLSILAGQTLAVLRKRLGPGARVLRAMPNTPGLIGAGISALAEDPERSADELGAAQAVLGALGEVVLVPEPLLDVVTGLSGSGPAYVFLFIEALTRAGIREGLSPEVSQTLVQATVLGAARLLRETGLPPALLRERVTSPGGTTQAGLTALADAGFEDALGAAVRAATARSRQLADPT
jgi:pyrroline-5-carboxylate reductase